MKEYRQYFGMVLASVLTALLVGGISNAAVWQWSSNSASNATADPSINWSEGMAPSSVNDSGRAMMARIANWRDDISGKLVTTGTATAYALASNSGYDAIPPDGTMIAFTPHLANGAAATLIVDGGTAYPLRSDATTPLSAGMLGAGTPYTVKFNLASSAWVVRDLYPGLGVPLGGIIDYTGTTAPNSAYVIPIGQCISRTTYAAYFALVSTTFGVCDGTTQFGVPDLRGRVLAGLDNMGGTAASRLTATYCTAPVFAAVCGGESQTLTTAQLASHTHGVRFVDNGHTHNYGATYDAGSNSGPNFGAGGWYYPTTSTTAGNNTVVGYVDNGAGTANVTAATGSATPHSIVQPTMQVYKLLRVL